MVLVTILNMENELKKTLDNLLYGIIQTLELQKKRLEIEINYYKEIEKRISNKYNAKIVKTDVRPLLKNEIKEKIDRP